MSEELEFARATLLHQMLPALVTAALVMALILLTCGVKQATLATALAFALATGVGLWSRAFFPMLEDETREADLATTALAPLRELLPLMNGDTSWNRLTWIALVALWVGHLARRTDLPTSAGWLLRAAASMLTAWVVVPSTVRADVDWLTPAFAAVIFIEWALLERLADATPGGGLAVLLALTFFVAGLLMLWATTLRFAEVAIILGATLLGIALIAAWPRVDIAGAIPGVAVLLPGVILMGERNYVPVDESLKLTWPVFALPALAPLILVETLPLKDWPRVRVFLLQLVLIAVPLGLTVLFAYLQAGPLTMARPDDWE